MKDKAHSLFRNFVQYYLILVNKIGSNLEKFLLKFNEVSLFTYTTGHFFLYWSFYWLIIRLCVRPWVLSFSHINELNVQLTPYIFTIISTLCFIMLAFIPTLITSTSSSLCLYIHKVHIRLLYSNANWRDFVTTLVLIESWVMYTKKRKVVVSSLIFYLFFLNFTGNDNVYLFMWLSFLYSFLYYSRVVYPIFPNYPKSKKLVLEMDGDFFSDSLDSYYGVKKPSYGIQPRNKRKYSIKSYHTTAQVLFPENSMFGNTGGKTWFHHKCIQSAARESILKRQFIENMTANKLPNHSHGTLGGKPFVFPSQEAANLVKSMPEVISESSGLSQGSRQIVKKMLGTTRGTYIIAGGVLLGTSYVCANTLITGSKLFQQMDDSFKSFGKFMETHEIKIFKKSEGA